MIAPILALLFQQPGFTETKDIVYAKVGGEELKLDVTTPKSDKPTPVMVLIHGGGWMAGSRADMYGPVNGMGSVGFACVNVEYRLAPNAQYPAQLEDVKASIRWVKENASKYNFNTSKIAVIGFSAGGHLAAMLATTGQEAKWDKGSKVDSSVAAAISFAGPTDLPTIWKHRDTQPAGDRGVIEACLPALLGDTLEKVPDKYKEASPIFHITKKTAPLLLMHGEDDKLVLKEQSEIMYRILQSQGVESELLLIPNAGHVDLGKDPNGIAMKIVVFLKKVLKL